ACQAAVAGVPMLEGDTARHVGPGEVLASHADGGLVDVEAVDQDVRVSGGDPDRCPSAAAADLRNLRPGSAKRRIEVVDPGEVLRHETALEERPVEVGLGGACEVAELFPGDAPARAV